MGESEWVVIWCVIAGVMYDASVKGEEVREQ